MAGKRRTLTALEKDNARRVKLNRERCRRECARAANAGWREQFARLEAALLKEEPHLAAHRHCGLAEDSDKPRKRVVLANGIEIYSTWYKPPTTDADNARALREQQWLNSPDGRKWYAATFASMKESQAHA